MFSGLTSQLKTWKVSHKTRKQFTKSNANLIEHSFQTIVPSSHPSGVSFTRSTGVLATTVTSSTYWEKSRIKYQCDYCKPSPYLNYIDNSIQCVFFFVVSLFERLTPRDGFFRRIMANVRRKSENKKKFKKIGKLPNNTRYFGLPFEMWSSKSSYLANTFDCKTENCWQKSCASGCIFPRSKEI